MSESPGAIKVATGFATNAQLTAIGTGAAALVLIPKPPPNTMIRPLKISLILQNGLGSTGLVNPGTAEAFIGYSPAQLNTNTIAGDVQTAPSSPLNLPETSSLLVSSAPGIGQSTSTAISTLFGVGALTATPSTNSSVLIDFNVLSVATANGGYRPYSLGLPTGVGDQLELAIVNGPLTNRSPNAGTVTLYWNIVYQLLPMSPF